VQRGGSGADPYTGGSRYVPGLQSGDVPQLGGSGYVSDPLTGGSRYVPPDEVGLPSAFSNHLAKVLHRHVYFLLHPSLSLPLLPS
jgi:hypothetical protein